MNSYLVVNEHVFQVQINARNITVLSTWRRVANASLDNEYVTVI